MDVTRPTGPQHDQSQLHLEVIQHLFRDLSVVLRTWVARLSHSHANQTVTRVPQTWFTILDGKTIDLQTSAFRVGCVD